ncbi:MULTISPECIES: tRNA lysidine(34) synthetase TilS [Roseobacteraceae]|jgi:tRNA(Ile)-lysidine synthase|uniref:tRNA(Ile)-lysidine synthase n=1 Tax=Pseudosulfitobacter pseudonitzschiae TaxID=1402135 RepID=A0A221K2C3_9RHOB|nr:MULTISPECIES: tRNA lysidine(34) synthetase TilS [Roseobacteraceae]ASM72997.1 tRNA(Ile)-lysidine synthase [Pseudosulfitobacter pseudonitzschiae]
MDDAALIAAIEAQLLPNLPEKIGVAVSGGGDSMALLSLVARVAQPRGIQVQVVSVNHGLRSGVQDELALVSNLCATLELPHHVENWQGWGGAGNLQGAARAARYDLIDRWAEGAGLDIVLLGHTADDQAETLMMRLARGAGVDGLSAMAPRRQRGGVTYVRPLLDITRAELRAYLKRNNIVWADDPSNDDTRFARVAMRRALTQLEPLGLTAKTLAGVARNMRQAREALDWQTFLAAREVAAVHLGAVRLDVGRFHALPSEISRRLLVHAILWINGGDYPPRRGGITAVQAAIAEGRTTTLDGCQLTFSGDFLWVFRELNAVRDIRCSVGDLWDNRWRISGPKHDPMLQVGPMGDAALAERPDWRDLDLPRGALLSMPAVWKGQTLLATPVFDDADGWSAEVTGGHDAFFAALLSRR